MPTYLVAWNQDDWPYEKLFSIVKGFKERGHIEHRWSCGNTKKIELNDRIFLSNKETSLWDEANDWEGVCIPSPIRAYESNLASLVAGAPFGLKAEVLNQQGKLIKRGKGKKGIFGSGTVTKRPYLDRHYDLEEAKKR